MGYEATSGLNVSNHYGVRDTGGVEGVIKTTGLENEYAVNVDGDGVLGFVFPVINGVEITGVDETFSTGAVSAITIGGVDIDAASAAAPVELVSSNTGVVSITGPTAGTVIVTYKRLA